ncbi:hypothetical protein P154DRAFT_486179 [Amniculicola lignicola CBS 123094]|uniref:Uncharacterized protein n=1 Tax=Amniculicola lignicola CBS 123094 TaxID=1392246 RepID=A0A6A5WNS0_9PLEO|nr:hypothetical protein P154DRAFT_486179 [Amniculicola lignicola CBS 123094]
MDSSELNANTYSVYLGFWTNWSQGAVRGATITLTRQHGTFLIAFLAIYVGMVGKSFWRLGCFSLHYYLSSDKPQDGLYHQRQAILRNSDTAQDGAWRLLMSMLAWRKRARRPFLRLLPLIVVAFLLSSAFGVASVFSAQVTTDVANEVLLKGDRCGEVNRSKPENLTAVYEYHKPYYVQVANKLINYGLRCYNNASDSRDIDGCSLYKKPQLPLFVDTNAPCPFDEKICKLKDKNIALDTGRMHSLRDFGINTPPKDQFEVRFRHECAPLVTKGYTKIVDNTDLNVGPAVRLFYGEGLNGSQTMKPWTHEFPLNFPYSAKKVGSLGTGRAEYVLGGTQALVGAELEGKIQLLWEPIPELRRIDADVQIFFLSAPGIRFTAPVNDPWFSAHKNASELYVTHNTTRPTWTADVPVSPMACTMQVQYCNPKRPKHTQCGPLQGIMELNKTATINQLFTTPSQLELVTRVDYTFMLEMCTMYHLIGLIGTSALHARYKLGYGYQNPLPDNQWQLEAQHWMKGELASLQDAFVRYVNGPPKELDIFLEKPWKTNKAAKTMCRSQMIVSTRYASFNVLGMSLILLLGGFIVVLDMSLEPLIAWSKKRRYQRLLESDQGYHGVEHPLYPVLEWSATSIMQLQRQAHEQALYGTWEKCDSDVPVTSKGQTLGVLDIEDVKRPVLKYKRWRMLGRSDTGFDTLVERGGIVEKMSWKISGV